MYWRVESEYRLCPGHTAVFNSLHFTLIKWRIWKEAISKFLHQLAKKYGERWACVMLDKNFRDTLINVVIISVQTLALKRTYEFLFDQFAKRLLVKHWDSTIK